MSRRLRAIGFEAFLWSSVLGYSCLMLFAAPISSPARLGAIAQRWARSVLWGLERIVGLKYHTTGGMQLTPGQGLVVVSNHQSAWETIALLAILPMPQTWVMKRELLRIPFFGWALAAFKPIAITRSSGRRAMRQLVEVGSERIRRGHCVVIFPEGTRVPYGARKRFGLGAARLAELSGAPVVPIAHDAGRFWPKQALDKTAGTIEVVIGQPIDTEGLSASSINQLIEDWIKVTTSGLPGNQST